MSDTDDLCRQIAAALDITLDELRAAQAGQDHTAELQGVADLLRAFLQLPDQELEIFCRLDLLTISNYHLRKIACGVHAIVAISICT